MAAAIEDVEARIGQLLHRLPGMGNWEHGIFRWASGGVQLRKATVGLFFSLRHLVLFAALFCLYWLILSLMMAFFWRDLGFSVSVMLLFVATAASHTVGMLSQLPGGLGAQDTSYAYFLSLAGIPLETALVAAVIWRLLIMSTDLGLSVFTSVSFVVGRRASS